MAFDVRVIFSGVGCFVPHSTEKRGVWVFPHGWDGGTSPDGSDLRRHRTFVRLRVADLDNPGGTSGILADTEVVWYLKRCGLELDITGGTATDLRVERIKTPADVAGLPVDQTGDFVWVAKLSEIFRAELVYPQLDLSSLAAISPDAVSATPMAAVGVQVPLLRGHLITYEPGPNTNPTVWEVRPHFSATRYTQGFASRAALEITNVQNLVLRTKKFDGSGGEQVVLRRTSGWVEVNVANLCCENVLGWPEYETEVRDDSDFRWIYQLYGASQLSLLQRLADAGFDDPIPRAAGGGSAGGPARCYFAESTALSY